MVKTSGVTAAEVNVERITKIIIAGCALSWVSARAMARKIVEEFPELRPLQQTSERDGSSRSIFWPLPWKQTLRENNHERQNRERLRRQAR